MKAQVWEPRGKNNVTIQPAIYRNASNLEVSLVILVTMFCGQSDVGQKKVFLEGTSLML